MTRIDLLDLSKTFKSIYKVCHKEIIYRILFLDHHLKKAFRSKNTYLRNTIRKKYIFCCTNKK